MVMYAQQRLRGRALPTEELQIHEDKGEHEQLHEDSLLHLCEYLSMSLVTYACPFFQRERQEHA